VGLETNPALRVGPEESGKAEGRVGREGSLSGDDLADAPLRDPNGFSKSVLSYPERLNEIFKQDFSRMNGRHISFHFFPPSAAIGYLNIFRAAVTPFKTDSPLIVYPNTQLVLAVAGQLFEPVSGRYPKEAQSCRPVNLSKLSKGNSLDGLSQLQGELSVKNLFQFPCLYGFITSRLCLMERC
jgi:hypothetical protein